jgi:hypothetical protein
VGSQKRRYGVTGWRLLGGGFVAGEVLFYMLEVAAHGAAGLVGIALGDGGVDGLVVFERGGLMLVETCALRETVVHGGKHAGPEAVDDAGEHAVASGFTDGDVELAVGDLGVGFGLDELAHLLQGLFDLGEVAGGGVERSVGGDFAFNEDAGAEEFEGAGAGVEHKGHGVDGFADVGTGAGADFKLACDFEGNHGFADGGSADATDLGEIDLAGETVAGLQALFSDVAGDARGNLLIAAVGLHGGRCAPQSCTSTYLADQSVEQM